MYYDRVKFDMLCFYGTFARVDTKVQKEAKKHIKLFKDNEEARKEIVAFLPKNGFTQYAEPAAMNKGIFYYGISGEKATDTPKECKELKEGIDFVQYNAWDIDNLFGGYDYAMKWNDHYAYKNKCQWLSAEKQDWYLQKDLSSLYEDKTIKTGDVYVSYKVIPLEKVGPCVEFGVYNKDQKGLIQKQITSESTNGEYKSV